jgi:hypothetical protein
MIQIEIAGGKPSTAILAPVAIPEKDVLAGESHIVPRQAIKVEQ